MSAESSHTSGVQQTVEGLLKAKIFAALGIPPGFSSFEIKTISKDSCRVNIFVNLGEGKKLTDSFYVKMNESDEIMSCDPPLKRRYSSSIKDSG